MTLRPAIFLVYLSFNHDTINLFVRLELKWSGEDRIATTRMLEVNLVNLSKINTCEQSAQEEMHSCANAESREDCEKSCGIASGVFRYV